MRMHVQPLDTDDSTALTLMLLPVCADPVSTGMDSAQQQVAATLAGVSPAALTVPKEVAVGEAPQAVSDRSAVSLQTEMP